VMRGIGSVARARRTATTRTRGEVVESVTAVVIACAGEVAREDDVGPSSATIREEHNALFRGRIPDTSVSAASPRHP